MKSSEPEEKSRKREKSNFSNFNNAPPVQENKIESIVDYSVSNSIISSITQITSNPFFLKILNKSSLVTFSIFALTVKGALSFITLQYSRAFDIPKLFEIKSKRSLEKLTLI